MGSRKRLTNNGTKCNIKVIRSLENRKALLKATTGKLIVKKEDLAPFMRDIWPLMKNVLTPVAKTVFTSLALTTAESAIGAAFQKTIFGSGMTVLKILNEEMTSWK